jgi:cytochrome c553
MEQMMKTWCLTISIAAALVSGGANAAGDPAAGETKAAVCVACHGPGGNSVVPMWPKIAGQHPEYTYKQLMDFKAGNRVNEQMSPQVIPLNEQDFQDLAAYFASQNQTLGAADPSLAELGEQIYRGGNPATGVAACSGCHGPAGSGLGAAKFPRISGQHAQYTEQTLKHFRDGVRANDPNSMMRGVAARMTDEEIAAVAQYIQGLTL